MYLVLGQNLSFLVGGLNSYVTLAFHSWCGARQQQNVDLTENLSFGFNLAQCE